MSAALSVYPVDAFTFTPATSGIENTTLIIRSSKSYVLRIYRADKKNRSEILLELEFINYLHDRGFPVPEVINNLDGNKLSEVLVDGQTWQAILMEYVEGEHPSRYTDGLIEGMAAIQAKMHLAGIDFGKHSGATDPTLQLRDIKYSHLLDLAKMDEITVRSFLERARAAVVQLSPTLPIGYCHLDFHHENLLINESGKVAAVLDFDDMIFGPVAVCLAYTLWEILLQTKDLSKVSAYAKTYQQRRPLSQEELNVLPKLILFRLYAHGSMEAVFDGDKAPILREYLTLEPVVKQLSFS